MASQSVPKPFQKILDPTKMGTWNIVRRPPIENRTVIQGKPREQNSNAFKTHQVKEGIRLRKALNAITHGKNIFVYHNLRTNQVVYSLTRYLEKTNVLRQMIYHGKKTVPASLRKDVWVPYYSVHFNEPKVGLRAYHLLREFSLQRQLSPPREMITITERYLNQKRPKSPTEAKEFDEKYAGKVGWLMEKKDRARAVMDQKATSVADVSAVLAIQEQEIADGFADGKTGYLTRTARRRRRAARVKEAAKAAEQSERVAALEKALSTSQVEYKIQEPDSSNRQEGNGIKILWTDVQDARYAESWPERVRHGELELTRDHVMSGPKLAYEFDAGEVLANESFKEKQPEQKA
ncbi:transcriptional regulation of mitochondrial recombination-domain-containing protein [Aspergillus coremiiformis]|uniref:Large ribosomal subunit protein mL67 n=1 Tax=Aspergillus coremiiformis TaxID=138285 RepID=A0A5N6ZKM1_9EURO|nr:transcriptional regulation of mitochondrial recombination-domain-containing protein [Aspergillus coremiiformis]